MFGYPPKFPSLKYWLFIINVTTTILHHRIYCPLSDAIVQYQTQFVPHSLLLIYMLKSSSTVWIETY